ncbi:MAG: glycerophosphodiester phosphodiesterase, partial [Candidatus Saccharibacteria bacterium]|nr:glycerophosphodiester phosphodiesterase [Candidatus Saccharibacteria bacterium]
LPTGELILMHDDKIDRISNSKGYVRDKTFAELRALVLEHDQKVLTLEEALEFIDKRVPVTIELKNAGSAKPTAELVTEFIQDRGWKPEMFLVSSFNQIEIAEFKKLMPSVKTGALISGVPVDYAAFAERAGADIAIVDDELLSKEYVDDAHARGLEIYVYSFFHDDVDRVARVKSLGADGMYVNFADKAREAIAREARAIMEVADAA